MKTFPPRHVFFAGYESPMFYSFDKEIMRKKKKYETSGEKVTDLEIYESEELLYVGTNVGDLNIFSIVSGEMILNWKFSDDLITQITYMKFEDKFLVLDYAGRILIYNPHDQTSEELKRYKKCGYFRGIITERDEILIMVGYKDLIKRWNLLRHIRLDTQSRASLDDDRTDFTYFHFFPEKKSIVGFS